MKIYRIILVLLNHFTKFFVPSYALNKTPIAFDISDPLIRGIKRCRHNSINVLYSYKIESCIYNSHKIGIVKDEKEIILNDDSTICYRNVTYTRRMDNTIYLQISTVYEPAKDIRRCKIIELIKVKHDQFRTIKREYVELDFAIVPEMSGFIDRFYDPVTNLEHYFISNLFRENVSIGLVRYAGSTIDDRVEGVICKEVFVSSDGDSREFIVIETLVNDGFIIRTLHRWFGVTNVLLFVKEDRVEYDIGSQKWLN